MGGRQGDILRLPGGKYLDSCTNLAPALPISVYRIPPIDPQDSEIFLFLIKNLKKLLAALVSHIRGLHSRNVQTVEVRQGVAHINPALPIGRNCHAGTLASRHEKLPDIRITAIMPQKKHSDNQQKQQQRAAEKADSRHAVCP